MNERIIELASQARKYADDNEEHWKSGSGRDWDSLFEQKFGELIIKQCIRLCDQVDIVGADECIDSIKEHFGVEE